MELLDAAVVADDVEAEAGTAAAVVAEAARAGARPYMAMRLPSRTDMWCPFRDCNARSACAVYDLVPGHFNEPASDATGRFADL
ncbi:MAG: hypothetical protein IRZ07_29795 [Microbispora sp.]|nr:hypothetical protein [Microbispora sp.]